MAVPVPHPRAAGEHASTTHHLAIPLSRGLDAGFTTGHDGHQVIGNRSRPRLCRHLRHCFQRCSAQILQWFECRAGHVMCLEIEDPRPDALEWPLCPPDRCHLLVTRGNRHILRRDLEHRGKWAYGIREVLFHVLRREHKDR